MRRLIIAPTAAREIRATITDSRVRFGNEAASRYRVLVSTALTELQTQPERPAAKFRQDLGGGCWLYHLRHASLRFPRNERVSNPRHFVAYRYTEEFVQIIGVLYDAMDIPEALSRDR